MRLKSHKSQTDRAVKKSVSMPLGMLVRAVQIQHQLLLPALSDYIQFVIRNDIQTRDTLHR